MRRYIKKEQVQKLKEEGKTYREISEILGFSYNSIARFCRKRFGILSDRGKSTRQNIEVNEKQKEILFGSLLGDACLVKHNKTFRGSVIHSWKQYEYIVYLHQQLESLCGILAKRSVKVNNKIYQEWAFAIRPNLSLEPFYQIFYEDFAGKKDIPKDLSLLTPQAIAIWFMDDGFLLDNGHSKTLGFSTCSFSLDGLMRLQQYLYNRYNIETIIRKNFYLIVRRKNAKTLVNLIKPYLINSMLYKIDGLC